VCDYTNKCPVLDMQTYNVQKRFTVSEMAADWHGLMIPRQIMRPSIFSASKQLDLRCSTQTYHCIN